jgi:hypothetical protein
VQLYWVIKRVCYSNILEELLTLDESSRSFNEWRESWDSREDWEQSRNDESFREDEQSEQNKENNQSIELSAANINFTVENASYAFENMIIFTNLDSNENLLRYSVTYDFEAFNHLTWNKSRFINEITLAYE